MIATIADIALETGYPAHRIRYLVKTRKIKPTVRVGELGPMLFDAEVVTQILQELDAITVRRIGFAPEMYA